MSRMALPPPKLVVAAEQEDEDDCDWQPPQQTYTNVIQNANNAGDDETSGLLRSVLGNTPNGFSHLIKIPNCNRSC